MSSSAPVVTSVSTPSTDVMASLTAAIAQMNKPVVSIEILAIFLVLTYYIRYYTVLHNYKQD